MAAHQALHQRQAPPIDEFPLDSSRRVDSQRTRVSLLESVIEIEKFTGSHPEIFGFVGYALLPVIALSQACTAIDKGLRSSQAEMSPDGKCHWLWERIRQQTAQHPERMLDDFTIFYGVRWGTRTYIRRKKKDPPVHDASDPQAEFHLYALRWRAADRTFAESHYPAPMSQSSILQLAGSGVATIEEAYKPWKASTHSDTSRTMFAALCDALAKGSDPLSGGPPQLVGLYRKGPGRMFGVVTAKGSFFQSCPFFDHPGAAVEWRDELFQRVHSNGQLVDGATRHNSSSAEAETQGTTVCRPSET